jgi:hypothetical protein
LYNPHNEAYDLYATPTFLDSGPGTPRFRFPKGSAIAAHGFLVVFPRTSYRFPGKGIATLRLFVHDREVNTVTEIPPLTADQAYIRLPDGGSEWQTTTAPTINKHNVLSQPTITPSPSRISTPTPIPTYTTTPLAPERRSNGKNNHISDDLKDIASDSTTPGLQPSQKQLIDGTQPAWSKLQHPTNTSSPSGVASSSTSSLDPGRPSPPHNDKQNILKKMIITLFILLLAPILLWCWQRFIQSKSKQTDAGI